MWIPVKVQCDFKNARHLILQNVTALKLRRFQTITSEDNLNVSNMSLVNESKLFWGINTLSVKKKEMQSIFGEWKTTY